jgi:glycerophosphoryl diester phosphodiesterase
VGSYAGTENQVAGVDNALPYRRVEIDATVTKDGQIAVIHDARLTRLTGRASTAYVNELTYAEIRALPYLYGDHIYPTSELIARAAELDVPIVVTIKKWGRIKGSGFAAQTLDRLYAAAQDQMRLRHTRTP